MWQGRSIADILTAHIWKTELIRLITMAHVQFNKILRKTMLARNVWDIFWITCCVCSLHDMINMQITKARLWCSIMRNISMPFWWMKSLGMKFLKIEVSKYITGRKTQLWSTHDFPPEFNYTNIWWVFPRLPHNIRNQ